MTRPFQHAVVVCGCTVGLLGCVRLVSLGPPGAGDAAVDLATAPSTACRAAASFGDDFDDGTLGGAWYLMSGSGSQIEERSGEMVARPGQSRASGGGPSTAVAFDLRGSAVTVEVTSVLAPSSLGWVQLQLSTPFDDRLRLYAQDGALSAAYKAGDSGFTELSSVPYQAAPHRWWRIREQDGIVHWEAGPDGERWTSLATAQVGFAVDWLHVQLEAGTSAAAGDLGQAQFDNVNPQAPRHDGSYQPCPLNTIGDDFEDGRRSGLWGSGPRGETGTVEERDGKAVLTPPAGAAGAISYATLNPFDVRGDAATIRIAAMLDTTTTARAELRLADDGGKTAAIVQQAGELRCVAGDVGAEQQLGQTSFDAGQHGWWRLREQGGQIFCETSADGVTFAALGSGPATVDTSAAFVQLRAVADGPLTAPGSFEVEDFNAQ